MVRRQMRALIAPALLVVALAGGCSKAVENNVAANNMAQAPTVEAMEEPDSVRGPENEAVGLPADQWVGRWAGPEGLFLDIQPSPNGKPGHYAITNRDTLDRQADYPGVAEGTAIRIRRDGADLKIRPGTGDETGFKYLAGKQDCLIVVAGREGYCR
ncbi:MAG TPA: hypothetical protein VF503_31270 [Sphingobium sp.]|uniref:hypothetical protein n=1 Tax=Sphingobium sp. TaxID=1912891 RepID=UPI002ED00773